jgi:NTP pyrophosphatase (non-canonical NTP hydrolase)
VPKLGNLTAELQISFIKSNSMKPITLQECQQLVDQWINTIGVRYFSELTNLAQLVEEVGEVARIMSRAYGDQSFKKSDENKELAEELSDVLFVLICIANQTGVDLTEAFWQGMEKRTKRDQERHRANEKLKK